MVLFMSEGKMGHEINRQTYTFESYLSDCHGEEETEPETLIYQSIRFLQMDRPITVEFKEVLSSGLYHLWSTSLMRL